MEKKRSTNISSASRKGTTAAADIDDRELAAVKAAAWAWYQHGSLPSPSSSYSCENDEFHVTSTRRTTQIPKPSRFKLEASILIMKSSGLKSARSDARNVEYSNNYSLLDDYEVKSISRRLEDLIAVSSSKRFDGEADNRQKMEKEIKDEKMKKKKKKSLMRGGGFWWMRHVAACRRGEGDVVASTTSLPVHLRH